MSSDVNLEQLIVDVLRTTPNDSATPGTIKGLLAKSEGIRPAEEDIRTKADELVEEGRLERVEGEGGEPRYRPVDSGA